MSFYNLTTQDANVYPDNYSPNRRNIRWTSIYIDNQNTIYGRVMPSEWPDGGHNSTYENNLFRTTDERINPDDPQFAPTGALLNPVVEEAPMRLSNLGRFYSATELGRVYDPIMWNVATPTGANLPWGDVQVSTLADSQHLGGNTLRIGRPEHPKFDTNNGASGLEAYHLLDLFHAGLSRSASAGDREGPVTLIQGQVNINTANRDALRAMAVGQLTMDPKMAKRTSEIHDTTTLMAPPVAPFKLSATELNTEANLIADSIILSRKTKPFASPSALSEVRDSTNNLVFGNKNLIPNGASVDRSDSAAEEIFARVYEASTVRSRNFRVWVVAQAISPSSSAGGTPEVLAEVRKAYTVFADPGVRASDGKINPTKPTVTILNENDF